MSLLLVFGEGTILRIISFKLDQQNYTSKYPWVKQVMHEVTKLIGHSVRHECICKVIEAWRSIMLASELVNNGWICKLELDKVGKHKYIKDTASSLLSQVPYHATMGTWVLCFSLYKVLHVELY